MGTTGGSDDSALERVADLESRWAELPAGSRQELAFRWVDQAIRRALPALLHREGSDHARYLESLPPIFDAGTLVRAEVVLAQLVTKLRGEVPAVSDSLSAVLNWLREVGGDPTIARACLLAVRTSRLVFGDNRVGLAMLVDLEMEALKLPPHPR
jgi:hypothetical protein